MTNRAHRYASVMTATLANRNGVTNARRAGVAAVLTIGLAMVGCSDEASGTYVAQRSPSGPTTGGSSAGVTGGDALRSTSLIVPSLFRSQATRVMASTKPLRRRLTAPDCATELRMPPHSLFSHPPGA